MNEGQINLNQLLEPVLTVQEADNLIERLEKARRESHRTGGADEALKNNLFPAEYERVKNFLAGNNKLKTDELLEQWADQAGSTRIMQLTISFYPTQGSVDQWKQYLAQSWRKFTPFRLKIETDRRLIGGAVLGWEGRIYDKSWGSKLAGIIQEVIRL